MARNRVKGWSSLEDVRAIAERRLPRPIYDFIASAAGSEVTAKANVEAFGVPQFLPRIAMNVTSIDTSTTIMGARLSFPLIVAPMGGLGMIDPDAELQLAKAASDAGVMFCLSSYSARPLEEVAKVCTGPKMFQVYMLADDGLAREYLGLAKDHGYGAIAITLDTAAQQVRDAFQRWNVYGMGGGIPLSTKLAFARHPRWIRRQRLLRGAMTDVERRVRARGEVIGPTFYEEMIRKDVETVSAGVGIRRWFRSGRLPWPASVRLLY